MSLNNHVDQLFKDNCVLYCVDINESTNLDHPLCDIEYDKFIDNFDHANLLISSCSEVLTIVKSIAIFIRWVNIDKLVECMRIRDSQDGKLNIDEQFYYFVRYYYRPEDFAYYVVKCIAQISLILKDFSERVADVPDLNQEDLWRQEYFLIIDYYILIIKYMVNILLLILSKRKVLHDVDYEEFEYDTELTLRKVVKQNIPLTNEDCTTVRINTSNSMSSISSASTIYSNHSASNKSTSTISSASTIYSNHSVSNKSTSTISLASSARSDGTSKSSITCSESISSNFITSHDSNNNDSSFLNNEFDDDQEETIIDEFTERQEYYLKFVFKFLLYYFVSNHDIYDINFKSLEQFYTFIPYIKKLCDDEDGDEVNETIILCLNIRPN